MGTIASGGFNPAKTQTQDFGGTMQMLAQANKMGENKVGALGQMLQGASDIGQASNTNKLNQFLNNYGGLSAEETRAGASQFGTVSDQAEKALHRNIESKTVGENRQHKTDLQEAKNVFQREEKDRQFAFDAGQAEDKELHDLTRQGNKINAQENANAILAQAKVDAEDAKTGSWVNGGNGTMFNTKTREVNNIDGWEERGGYNSKGNKNSSSTASKKSIQPTGYTKTALANETSNTQAMVQDIIDQNGSFRIIKGSKATKDKKAIPDKYELNGDVHTTIPQVEDAYKAMYTNSPDALAIQNQKNDEQGFNGFSDLEQIVDSVGNGDNVIAKGLANAGGSDVPYPKGDLSYEQRQGIAHQKQVAKDQRERSKDNILSFLKLNNYEKRKKAQEEKEKNKK